MGFSDIVQLVIWCVLNNYLRKVLANMPLQSIRRRLTDLNGQAKGRIVQSLNKKWSVFGNYMLCILTAEPRGIADFGT